MATLTFRAPDSATALDMVQRKFGQDALILQTITRDGQVEITASDAADAPQAQPPRGPQAYRVPAPPVTPQPQAQPQEQPQEQPQPQPHTQPNTAALPGFLHAQNASRFAQALLKAQASPAEANAPAAQPNSTGRGQAARTALHRAKRIVLVGPVGAGKTMAALQLGAAYLQAQPGNKVEFVFCGNGSHSDGALLAQKSHLLGMTTVFTPVESLALPPPAALQIVLASGRGGPGPAAVALALAGPAAQAALVLPAGLHPDRVQGLAAHWGGLNCAIILASQPALPATSDDCTALHSMGLAPAWVSDGCHILNGLTLPDCPDMFPLPKAEATQ